MKFVLHAGMMLACLTGLAEAVAMCPRFFNSNFECCNSKPGVANLPTMNVIDVSKKEMHTSSGGGGGGGGASSAGGTGKTVK